MRYVSKIFYLFLIQIGIVTGAYGTELTFPIVLDYGIVHQALTRQLFTGPDNSAQLFADEDGCNSVTISDPQQIRGTDDDLMQIQIRVYVLGGTPFAGRCLLPFSWEGNIEVLQEVYVPLNGQSVAFKVVDSRILGSADNKRQLPAVLWDRIKNYIHPQLSSVIIDLAPAVSGLQSILASTLIHTSGEQQDWLSTLTLKKVVAETEKLNISLSLDVPDAPFGELPEERGPLTETEMAQWDTVWQSWDGFATWLIKTMAGSLSPELASSLGDILLEARYDLREALATERENKDPVRELFIKTWLRLSPLIHDSSLDIPGAEALQLAAFISAADALQILDKAAPHMGISFDGQTFRRLARLLLPSVSDAELSYSTDVDPALRALLGLNPDFEEVPAVANPFAWLISSAHAATVDLILVKKLTGWVPNQNDLNDYLSTINQLLDQVIRTEQEKGKVPLAFFTIYESLVLATAWQESCWRQYINKSGTIAPILSPSGSVGLMQVNTRVWRGIYDPVALRDNIAYNARAGNEILVHYLVDYAIKKKEHEISGNASNLAKATYAAYNGGPGHLARYRNPETRKSLKKIDDAFWNKYRSIRQKGVGEVKSCYGS